MVVFCLKSTTLKNHQKQSRLEILVRSIFSQQLLPKLSHSIFHSMHSHPLYISDSAHKFHSTSFMQNIPMHYTKINRHKWILGKLFGAWGWIRTTNTLRGLIYSQVRFSHSAAHAQIATYILYQNYLNFIRDHLLFVFQFHLPL